MTQNSNLNGHLHLVNRKGTEKDYEKFCYLTIGTQNLSRIKDFCKFRKIRNASWERLANSIQLSENGGKYEQDEISIIDIIIQKELETSHEIIILLEIDVVDLQIAYYPQPLPAGIGNYEVIDNEGNILGYIYKIGEEYRVSKVKNSSKLKSKEIDNNTIAYTDRFSAALGFVDYNLIQDTVTKIEDNAAIREFNIMIGNK